MERVVIASKEAVLRSTGVLLCVAYAALLLVLLVSYRGGSTGTSYSADSQESNSASGVEMTALERTEYVDGEPDWAISARKAQLINESGILRLRDATLTMYPKTGRDGTQVITSEKARVLASEKGKEEALLEGGVTATLAGGATVSSSVARYEASKRLLRFPEHVQVEGPGYLIKGGSMRAYIDTNIIEFESPVDSVFKREDAAQDGKRNSNKADGSKSGALRIGIPSYAGPS